MRLNTLEMYLSWEEHFCKKVKSAHLCMKHVVDLADYYSFRFGTLKDNAYFRQQFKAPRAPIAVHDVTYESLISGALGNAVWFKVLSFLGVEILPPSDMPLDSRISQGRLPCTERVLNWQELVQKDDILHTSVEAALCASDTTGAQVGDQGSEEARKHLHLLTTPGCTEAPNNSAPLRALFEQFLHYPLAFERIGIHISASVTASTMASDVAWLERCLQWKFVRLESLDKAIDSISKATIRGIEVVLVEDIAQGRLPWSQVFWQMNTNISTRFLWIPDLTVTAVPNEEASGLPNETMRRWSWGQGRWVQVPASAPEGKVPPRGVLYQNPSHFRSLAHQLHAYAS